MQEDCFQLSSTDTILAIGVTLNLGYTAIHQISGVSSDFASRQLERLQSLSDLFDEDGVGEYDRKIRQAKRLLFSTQQSMARLNSGLAFSLIGFAIIDAFCLLYAVFDRPSCDPTAAGVLFVLLSYLPAPIGAVLVWGIAHSRYLEVRKHISELTTMCQNR